LSTLARLLFVSAAPTSTLVTGSAVVADDTLFALRDGNVEFGTRRGRRVVNVTPVEAPVEA